MKKISAENLRKINGGKCASSAKKPKSATKNNGGCSGGYMSLICKHTLMEFGRVIGAYK